MHYGKPPALFRGKNGCHCGTPVEYRENADNIVVLSNGSIVEERTHTELVQKKVITIIWLKTSLNWRTKQCLIQKTILVKKLPKLSGLCPVDYPLGYYAGIHIICRDIGGSYFIKYPRTIKAQIVISSFNPPVDLIARRDAHIDSFFVANDSRVQKEISYSCLPVRPITRTSPVLKTIWPIPSHPISWHSSENLGWNKITSWVKFSLFSAHFKPIVWITGITWNRT